MDEPGDPVEKLKLYYQQTPQETADDVNVSPKGPEDWKAGNVPEFIITKS